MTAPTSLIESFHRYARPAAARQRTAAAWRQSSIQISSGTAILTRIVPALPLPSEFRRWRPPFRLFGRRKMSTVDLEKTSHARFAASFYMSLMKRGAAINRRDSYLQMANDAEMKSDYALSTELRCLAVGICDCFIIGIKCEGCWSEKLNGGHDAGIFRIV